MPQNYRKRRIAHGPSKNELRSARNERAEIERQRAGTLRQKFPQISRLEVNFRLEGPAGNAIDDVTRLIDLDEPLKLEIPCPSTCGKGLFNLTGMLETSAGSSKESFDGLEICQMASYMDPRAICGTKLYYRFTIAYKGETT